MTDQWSDGAMKQEVYNKPAAVLSAMSFPSGSRGAFGLFFATGMRAVFFHKHLLAVCIVYKVVDELFCGSLLFSCRLYFIHHNLLGSGWMCLGYILFYLRSTFETVGMATKAKTNIIMAIVIYAQP